MEFNSFEIGSHSIEDYGGKEILLNELNLTDVLIGSCTAELNRALGESTNVYEDYHVGDQTISDIELRTFDSALIQDSGIQMYEPGVEACIPPEECETSDESINELAKITGIKLKDKEEVKKLKEQNKCFNFIHEFLSKYNSDEKSEKIEISFINDDRFKFQDSEVDFDENGKIVSSDEIEFKDSDFMSDEDTCSELEAIASDMVDKGNMDYLLKMDIPNFSK